MVSFLDITVQFLLKHQKHLLLAEARVKLKYTNSRIAVGLVLPIRAKDARFKSFESSYEI